MAWMPTSGTGISTERYRDRQFERGFSLLELMIVVVIIGIFAGSILFSMRLNGDERVLEKETLRLSGLLSLLREEALMQNRDYGIVFTSTGYRFFVYDYVQLQWFPPPNDRLFVDYTLPQQQQLELWLEDRALELDPEFDETPEEDATPEPQLLVLSTGEITPFELDFYLDPNGGRLRLTGELDGQLSVARDGFD
jgi:general secretion pathway protein H